MIIDFSSLCEYRRRVTLVDGVFDPLHEGHVAYFSAAADLGLPVLCNVSSDAYLVEKHPPLLSQVQRAQVIDGLAAIDFTLANPHDTEDVLKALQPRYYAKGADWRNRLPARETEVCNRTGVEIVFLDTIRNSSGRILAEHAARLHSETAVDAWESVLHSQSPVPPESYDRPYFMDRWRENDVRYDVESRRKTEGRHPRLVKEVFEPQRVLDMGCGPGAFMLLLEEEGIHADGIDIAPASRAHAPEAVRSRIRTGSILHPLVEDRAYDLVICREVLEHMTVLEIREAVTRMCRASSRFVYVTTRFHPAPASLFDVTDEPRVDPTHITLMNKSMLRLFFVLEGLRRRDDLERRMDWLGKGRVLVYEKTRYPGA